VKEKNSIICIKKQLDIEVDKRNISTEVSENKLDPILVAYRHKDPTIALICALFSYGNVKQIVKFLDSLDFSLLKKSDEEIKEALKNHYYRFQKSEDIIVLFIVLKRLNEKTTLEEVFANGYDKNKSVIDGVHSIIELLLSLLRQDNLNLVHTHLRRPHKQSTLAANLG